MNIKFMLQV